MIWMICVRTPPSNLPVGDCQKAEMICTPSPTKCHVGRTPLTCAPLIRMTGAMVNLWCKESCRRAPRAITLDIDDTADTVHGHQQLSMFNAHYDKRCFLHRSMSMMPAPAIAY